MSKNTSHLFPLKFFLVVAITLIASPVQAEFRRAETDNFIIYAETTDEILSAYARNLERFDALLRHYTGASPEVSEVKFTIYLVENHRELQRRMGGSGYIGGIYIADMRGPYAALPLRSSSVLLHEYVHHFMLRHAPAAYPRWYREGFAEFFSTVIFDEEGHAQLGRFPSRRSYELEYSRRHSFEGMLTESPEWNSGLAYVQRMAGRAP